MDVISNSAARYVRMREEEMSLDEYLALCQRDPMAYASAAQRMLMVIGEPEMVDTRNDPLLSRLFANKVIRRYPAFAEFYGMEDAIEQVVSEGNARPFQLALDQEAKRVDVELQNAQLRINQALKQAAP